MMKKAFLLLTDFSFLVPIVTIL